MTAIADKITEAKSDIHAKLAEAFGESWAAKFMKENYDTFDKFSFAAIFGRRR
ncbi:hypothetical protein A4U53_031080 [Rhizobium ruizarguesonis]|uniref:Uncharacterized protein n=1 Tax=Rhizobium ruizarguesonis TaxID=2081791 RepID=A0ACD5EMX5_9HYPH|nr:hypothetical protein [Rhizobium leguminosarum]